MTVALFSVENVVNKRIFLNHCQRHPNSDPLGYPIGPLKVS